MAHPRRRVTGTGSSTARPPSPGWTGAVPASPVRPAAVSFFTASPVRSRGAPRSSLAGARCDAPPPARSRGKPLHDPAAALLVVEHEPQPVVQPVPAALPEL